MDEVALSVAFPSLVAMFEAIPDEQAAIDHFRAIRWKNGAFCPYCGSTRLYHFSDNRTHKCGDCRQRFSIKVGTIFEDTKIQLRKWLAAIWLITSHKKGIASTQLARDIGVTQKTAWFMLHRLRHAARTRSFNRPIELPLLDSDGRISPPWRKFFLSLVERDATADRYRGVEGPNLSILAD